MCRAYPGPRCTNHASTYLKRAKERLKSAKETGDVERIARAQAQYDANMARYRLTPGYESEVTSKIRKLEERIEKNSASWKKATVKRRMRELRELQRKRDDVRNARLSGRAAAREQETKTLGMVKGISSVKSLAALSEAKRLVAEGKGGQIVVDDRGKMSTAAKVAKKYDKYANGPDGEKFKQAEAQLRKKGFTPAATTSHYSHTYNRNLEPQFTQRNGTFTSGTFQTAEGRKKLNGLGNAEETRVRVHDHNGFTHEATVRMSLAQDDEGNFYVTESMNGASSLYGNARAQDSMPTDGKGSLTKSDAKKWRTRKAEKYATKEEALSAMRERIKEYEYEKDEVRSGLMAHTISHIGTSRMSQAFKRGEQMSHSTLDQSLNAHQTSGAGFTQK